MIKFSRRTIAAGTITALGSLGAVAVAAGVPGSHPGAATAAPAAAPALAPEVRTVVVHRTIKRVKHLPAKHPVAQSAAAPPPSATPTSDSTPAVQT
ncbi:MAG: hypothetical protein F2796_04270, partial [Actinobacteria bacterium]|nr:hypothetical protein [Actinomycetota bacterium]